VRWRSDGGAGSVLAIAVIGAVIALTGLAVPLYLALATKSIVRGAADSAALAAADARSGAVAGFPCAVAAKVATANESQLVDCTVDGLVATVTVHRWILAFDVVATATAGPPGQNRD
jgi:secretion/DNA translocation related TadE-like protein